MNDQVLQLLNDIEDRKVAIEVTYPADKTPDELYCGTVEYRIIDSRGQFEGWQLAIYNDCCEWDYIEWVHSPSGSVYEYGNNAEIEAYEPSQHTAKECYRIGCDNPYHATWVEWTNLGKWDVVCLKCKEICSFSEPISSTEYEHQIGTFSVKHLGCGTPEEQAKV